MKNLYSSLFFALFFSSWATAQVIYSDQFDATLTTESNSAYDISLENGNLLINGNGTAGAFNAFEYLVHSDGESTAFDMSANPQIFIRAKANGPGVLRVDAKDAEGYVTNLSANYASLTEDYAVYTLDFADDFNDGGFGGSPCESGNAPCPVNSAEISSLVFFVDDATGGYAGAVEIDWISVGEPLEEESMEEGTTDSVYSDDFETTLTTESNSAYDVSLDNGYLKIEGNGTAGPYNAFEYTPHAEGNPTTFDMTASPQIYIKARANISGALRVDGKDIAGYVTNLSPNFATLTENFAIFTLDFTGDFNDGGYGGSPCESADAPCPVNPAEIANLVFFVDDATGGYAGTIEIDWISVGKPLEVEQTELLYSDQFEDSLTTESNDAYTVSLVEGSLNIVGNGTAGPYNAFQYGMHEEGKLACYDLSAAPKLYIKAKGSNSPTFRIDLLDDKGFVTNLQAKAVTLNDEYGIYTLDFEGSFLDGGYGGSPCESADAPCPVDATLISNLLFYVNDATGGYEGVIDIDWISFGEPLEDALPAGKNIRYNQVGYHLNRQKLINLTSETDFDPLPYTVTDANGDTVATGTTSATQFWAESAEYVATIDVSEIAAEGSYTISVDGKEAQFSVSENVYEALNEAAFKYYYFNRASTEITAQYGGEYARALGLPDEEVLVHPSAASDERPAGTVISAPKGWYDAGDYNKYIVNSGISTYTLLAAFEHYPSYFASKAYDIPETVNDLPDVLDEVKWNLDWMLAMQDPNDGGVYHKLTGLNFQGIIMPADYTAERYVVQKSTAAALNFAAVTAVASRIYEKYDDELPGYGDQLLEASKRAYEWALQNPEQYYQQPADVFTGEYGDNNVTDEFQWAAVELLITTGEEDYANDVDVEAIGNGIPFWGYTAPLALVSIAAHANQLSDDLDVDAAIAKLLETSNQLKDKVNNSAMRVAMGSGDFNWGSNGQAGNQLMLLLMAYQIEGDKSFLDAAFTASDYLLGRNATGYSFVSGFGGRPMNNPHHRISEADSVADAVPGMLAGGPHSGQQDGCPGYPSNAPARSYVDTWCSYTTNEVTINWNAPLFYATAGLYLTLEETPEEEEEELSFFEKLLKLYPNPFIDALNIDIGEISEVNIKVFSMDGRLMISENLQTATPMDVTALPRGIYIVQVDVDGRKFSAKVIKR